MAEYFTTLSIQSVAIMYRCRRRHCNNSVYNIIQLGLPRKSLNTHECFWILFLFFDRNIVTAERIGVTMHRSNVRRDPILYYRRCAII